MKYTHLITIVTLAFLTSSVTSCDNQQNSSSSAKSELIDSAQMMDPHEAATSGNLTALKAQITNDYKFDTEKKFGLTVLMIASTTGQSEIVDYLISQGANINTASTRDKSTALLLAAKNGHNEIVTKLLNADADINAADNQNSTALALASSGGHTAVVQNLIDNGASVNILFKKFSTPLSEAAKQGNLELVKLLIDNNATLEPVKAKGGTPASIPLVQAAVAGHLDVINALIDGGADTEAINFQHKGALLSAILENQPEAALLLMNRGANPENNTFAEITPLMAATRREQVEVIKYLIEKNKLDPGVHSVPHEIDELVARLKLAAFNVDLDELTDEQKRYLATWESGTI